MSLTAESVLNEQLDRGERLLWAGQPRGDIRLRAQDAFLIPFSLLWCGFAIFWKIGVIHSGAPLLLRIWGIPFVCVGLFFVFGRFFQDAYTRARTFYGVTSERVLIVSGFFSRQIKSLQLRTLTDVSLIQKSDGSGTITFGPSHSLNSFFPSGAWPGARRYAPPAFDLVEQAKHVYDIIRLTQKTT